MATTTTTTTTMTTSAMEGAAYDAMVDTMENGQSREIDDMSRSNAPIDKLWDVANKAADKRARNVGLRPLFRGINLDKLGY